MDKLIQLIEEHTAMTGGKSGISLVRLCEKSALPVSEVREMLGRAVSSGKIQEREGVNQQLYFKN